MKNSDEKQIKEALDIALDGPNYGDSIYLENSTKGMLHHIVGTHPCRFLLNLGDGNFKIYTLGDGVESLIKYNSEKK